MVRRLLACAVLASILAFGADAVRAADAIVFAAASTTDALQQVGDLYKSRTGKEIAFSFAASSTLARQIEASSGADIFVSADEAWMDYLDTRGLIAHATRRNLLGNRLVLIAPAGTQAHIAIVPGFDLTGALRGGRLAVADPQSVPAGKYAKAALLSLGVWSGVAGRLAPAENVRAALALVARGETPFGIVYASDALIEPNVRVVATFPPESHSPILYPAALTKDSKAGARAFLDFLEGREADVIFVKAGFTPLKAKR